MLLVPPSFRKEVGLDLFFPKQMQENLKVRKSVGKAPTQTLFMVSPTRLGNRARDGAGDTWAARVSLLPWAICT